jgi:hypothetical protein
MRITFELYLDDVVRLLQIAAAEDDELLKLAPNKAQIKDMCQRVIREHGLFHDDWSYGLSDFQEIQVSGWAIENARRYTW